MKASPPIHPGHAWILGVVVDERAPDDDRRAVTADVDTKRVTRSRDRDRAIGRDKSRPTVPTA